MIVRILILPGASVVTFSVYAASKADGAGLQLGVLPGAWRTGGPNCVTVPDWQVREYHEDKPTNSLWP